MKGKNLTIEEKRALAAQKPGWWRALNRMRPADLNHKETRQLRRRVRGFTTKRLPPVERKQQAPYIRRSATVHQHSYGVLTVNHQGREFDRCECGSIRFVPPMF
jgi:hypothetical protein